MSERSYHATSEFFEMAGIVGRAFEIEVDDAFVERIGAYLAHPATGLSAEAQKHAERGAHQLESALRAYAKADDPKLWRDYLDASYAELFLGVTPQATEPVESCYMNDERVLYARQFFEVKDEMDRHGFAAPANFQEPLDHIAMEWRYFLALLENGADDDALAFKQAHMDTWMPRALAALIDADDMGFYTGVANLARAVLCEVR